MRAPGRARRSRHSRAAWPQRAPAARRPTLSFMVGRRASRTRGFEPLGGGICLGNRRVTEPKADGGIAWSPDGSRVAFYRQTGTLTADVFVADADGGNLRNLTRGKAQFSWAPDWSPDGSRSSTWPPTRTSSGSSPVRPDGSGRGGGTGHGRRSDEPASRAAVVPGRNVHRLHAHRRHPRHPA